MRYLTLLAIAAFLLIAGLTGCSGGGNSLASTPTMPITDQISFDANGEMVAPAGAIQSNLGMILFPWFEDDIARGGTSEGTPVTCGYDGVTNTWTVDCLHEYKLILSQVGSSRHSRGGYDEVPAEYAFQHVSGGQIIRSSADAQHIVGFYQPGLYKGGAVFTVNGQKQFCRINVNVLSFEEAAAIPVKKLVIKAYALGDQYSSYTESYYPITSHDSGGMLLLETGQAYISDIEYHSMIEQGRGAGSVTSEPTEIRTYAYDFHGNESPSMVETGYWDHGKMWKLTQNGQYILEVDEILNGKIIGTFFEGVSTVTGLGMSK